MEFVVSSAAVVIVVDEDVVDGVGGAVFFSGAGGGDGDVDGFDVGEVEDVFVVGVEAVDFGFYEKRGYFGVYN